MKIGMMAPPWVPVPPPAYGGTEAVIDRLARGIHEAGHDVLLWTTGDSTCPVPRGHVFDRAQPDRIGIAAIELRHLLHGYRAFQDWGADVIHDHTLIGPVYARGTEGPPVVTTNHGPFNAELNDLYRAVTPEVRVIAISQDQASRAVDVPIEAMIHHGLDLEDFPVGDGRGDDAGPYFAFLGRMAPEKGARRAALAARQAGVRLVIAAKMREPWERQFFTDRVEPLLDDRIVFIGEVNAGERVRLLGGATALFNPIRWPEPFGLAMIESLACGTPVLAYREGSAPELIEDGITGHLVDRFDQFVDRIDHLGELDRQRCRTAVEQGFTTERMVADHLCVYERMLASRIAGVPPTLADR